MSTTKYIVNNVSGQTINGEQLQPYKVYTALLTQNGTSNTSDITSGNITIGVTYWITGGSDGDFTNVGAPNNDADTYFMATGTTPNSWGTSGALRTNAGAPIVTVLENTIGDVWFTYENTGRYYANSNALFTDNKTTVFGGYYNGDTQVYVNYIGNNSSSGIYIQTGDPADSNNYLNNTPIEIRVYN